MRFCQFTRARISMHRFCVKRLATIVQKKNARMARKPTTDYGARLRQARAHAKMTQAKAAEELAMSQGTLSELERQGHGSTYTAALASLFGVNSLWLETGAGNMLDPEQSPISPRETALLEFFRALTPEQQDDALRRLQDQKQLNEQLLAQLRKTLRA